VTCFRPLIVVVTAFPFFLTPMLCGQSTDAEQKSESPQDPLQRPRAENKASRKQENAYKRWIREVQLIITPEEEAAFRKLSNDAERESFIEQFWQRRDHTPDTAENEYKEEFYRRLAYADEHFSAGKPGRDTDRGRMYILHGPPDTIDAHPAGGPYVRTAEEGGGQTETFPFEIWRYRHLDGIGQEVEIEFVDTCGCADYHMTLDRGEKDAGTHVPGMGPTDMELLGRSSKADRLRGGVETLGPSLFGGNRESKEFDRIMQAALLSAPPPVKMGTREDVRIKFRYNLLPFNVRVDFVRASADLDLVPITIQVADADLAYASKDGLQHASVQIYGRLTTLTGKVVQAFEEHLRLNVPPEEAKNFAGKTSMYQEVVSLRPGRYRLDLVIKDVLADKAGVSSQAISVPELGGGDGLTASTLIVADVMEPVAKGDIGRDSFVLGPMRVRPRLPQAGGDAAMFLRNERVNAWMEAYNLQGTAVVRYELLDVVSKAPVFELEEEVAAAANQITVKKMLPQEKLTPGVYRLKVTVKDASGQAIEREETFAVR
jgi:GWxTD domain-containing protein